MKTNQKVIFDGKAFFIENNFSHWFSKPKVINRDMATRVRILAHVDKGKELLAITFGFMWGKRKNIVGRLQLHVPGKFDSLEQNKTKNFVALFLQRSWWLCNQNKTSTAVGKLPRPGGSLTPHSSEDFSCQTQLRFMLAGHADTSFTSFLKFTEDHLLMRLS